jgi:uncharacterized membrane protein YidH (DUF202 family)
VGLEAIGYLVRVTPAPYPIARPLSMELPWSLPRLFVAGLFAAAAVLAALGAGRAPGRRTWWTAVAVLAAGIAVVKAGSELHKEFLVALGVYERPLLALVISAPLALAAVGWLAWLSRHERRDRRRMLLCLGAYAFAAVGLSTVSSAAEGRWGHGSVLTATAAFLEESGEALSAVAFLFAVLIGVAPRLVLPAGWLRRSADAESLDVVPAGVVAEPGR